MGLNIDFVTYDGDLYLRDRFFVEFCDPKLTFLETFTISHIEYNACCDSISEIEELVRINSITYSTFEQESDIFLVQLCPISHI
jgi:hypothetical protein